MAEQTHPGETQGKEVCMVDLLVDDQIMFDGEVLTVIEPPQDTWGIVEVWVEELDFPLMGSAPSSTVLCLCAPDRDAP